MTRAEFQTNCLKVAIVYTVVFKTKENKPKIREKDDCCSSYVFSFQEASFFGFRFIPYHSLSRYDGMELWKSRQSDFSLMLNCTSLCTNTLP